jgi:hypothetical protein
MSNITFNLVNFVTAIDKTQNEHLFTYKFENFYHPLVDELKTRVKQESSLAEIFNPEWLESLRKPEFFSELYHPTNDGHTHIDSFPEEIDLSPGGPYANYNWELFFHIPMTVAVHLSKSQRFAEAQRWFHFIFDPTSNDPIEPDDPIHAHNRFWKFLAFRQSNHPQQMDELLRLLSDPGTDSELRNRIKSGYQAILDKPFQPHAVARTRPIAYQYSVVMKYLDNLIAWGDHLFQQDTSESINEATQIYVLAANILGTRPQRVPPRGKVQPKTFAQLKSQRLLDVMGNALVDLEGQFPIDLAGALPVSAERGTTGPLFGIGRTLYFCIPQNEKMLGYWDTVSDRLFKIRHCMNIAGVVRPLALFDPPLDPGMLVKASAAGIDVGSIINGQNQPVGPIRSIFLIQKALELAAEVRSLGNSLLSALEKGDAENMALLRQKHEIELQTKMREVRFLQWKSAEESTRSLLISRETTLERLRYYQRLLGLPGNPIAQQNIPINREVLSEKGFTASLQTLVSIYEAEVTRQDLPLLRIKQGSSPDILAGYASRGTVYLNTNEDIELNVHLPAAKYLHATISGLNILAAALMPMPSINIDGQFWGIGGHTQIASGKILAAISKTTADVAQGVATWEQDQAGMAARYASYERRADEWLLQYNLAAHELKQNGRQILTSLIAEQIAHHEYQNVIQQIDNARELDQRLEEKTSNEQLYLWMQGEISKLYYEYYRFAFDTSRKAEQAMKRELMRPELEAQEFIKFNYWDGGRKGLLSGEALHLDLKRMEMAYHENNKRELELIRNVSLRQLDPIALLNLKATGTCQVTIPEWLYDLDCPGHYMRRIKTVALSIPAVVGPFSSVNCTLSLLRSSIRKSPSLKDNDYMRQGQEDDRFINYTGAIESIVTSSANNDSGLFETNLRDERFLPFEGSGAISTWKLDLPKPNDFPAFDYATISDVILHIRYTARQGVPAEKVNETLRTLLAPDESKLALLFSLKHDFPTEWAAFVNTSNANNIVVRLQKEHFPYWVQGKSLEIVELNHLTSNSTGLVSNPIIFDSVGINDDILIPLNRTRALENKSDSLFLLVRYTAT